MFDDELADALLVAVCWPLGEHRQVVGLSDVHRHCFGLFPVGFPHTIAFKLEPWIAEKFKGASPM